MPARFGAVTPTFTSPPTYDFDRLTQPEADVKMVSAAQLAVPVLAEMVTAPPQTHVPETMAHDPQEQALGASMGAVTRS